MLGRFSLCLERNFNVNLMIVTELKFRERLSWWLECVRRCWWEVPEERRVWKVGLPHPQELWLLSGRRRFRLHLQAVDVSDGNDGGGYVPRQAHEGADHHEHGHPEQVQVVACPFLGKHKGHAMR